MKQKNEKCNLSPERMLVRALIPSILGILLCVITFCGTTFAWLTDSVSSNSFLIAGNFTATVTVTGNDSTVYPVSENTVSLPAGTYSVNVVKGGNASGYVLVTFDAEVYVITAFPATFTLTVGTERGGDMTVGFLSNWGTVPATATPLSNGMSIGDGGGSTP